MTDDVCDDSHASPSGDTLCSMSEPREREPWARRLATTLGCAMLALSGCGSVERASPPRPVQPSPSLPDAVRRIHVSSAGDDAADGLTAATARRTLAAALMLVRDARGDEVLLRRGDVFDLAETVRLPFSGESTARPFVLAAAAKHLASVTLELGGKSPTIIDELSLIHISEPTRPY